MQTHSIQSIRAQTATSRRAAGWLPVLLFVFLLCPGSLYSVFTLLHKPPQMQAVVVGQLEGATINQTRPPLTLRTWLSGDFQTKFGLWFGQIFGLRAWMVRTDNQIGYTVFRKSNSPTANLVIGKNKTLYEKIYLEEYCDIDPPLSDAHLDTVARDMAEVGARFRARGVGFVVWITPSKAATYPEFIPDTFMARKTGRPRSYDKMVALMNRYHVAYVDGPKALHAAKAAHPDAPPLFGRGGIHYDGLGLFYAARPLVSALQDEGGKPIPPLQCAFPVPVDHNAIEQDADVARLLNVLHPPTHNLTPHPKLFFDWNASPGAKPQGAGNLTLVGGSFCWQLTALLHQNNVYSNIDYYYYYRLSQNHYPGKTLQPVNVATLDWEKTFLRSNVVVLEINEQMLSLKVLPKFGEVHFLTFLRDAKRHLPPVKQAVY